MLCTLNNIQSSAIPNIITFNHSSLFSIITPSQVRSEILATYALCGFSNFSSIGIQLGGLGPMAPTRVTDMAKIAMRALFAGIIACLMTACVAGKCYNCIFILLCRFVQRSLPPMPYVGFPIWVQLEYNLVV